MLCIRFLNLILKTDITEFSPSFFLVAYLMAFPVLGTNSMTLYDLMTQISFVAFLLFFFSFESSISSLPLVAINPLHQAI